MQGTVFRERGVDGTHLVLTMHSQPALVYSSQILSWRVDEDWETCRHHHRRRHNHRQVSWIISSFLKRTYPRLEIMIRRILTLVQSLYISLQHWIHENLLPYPRCCWGKLFVPATSQSPN